ncbi:MAG: response regulator, partial [Betaproteobacteria bacterium]|nr:response regulator [Betaproteobacteria bacterium]
ILLVDDQPQRLLTYETILSSLGQNLVRATSGREALQRLMEDDFAAILLDVNMPDMDGFETAALIHQHPRFEKTPIIFVTGVHVTDLDRLKGYELGAVDYVYIPVVPEILRGKVQVLVELFAKKRELERLNLSLEQANIELALANSTLQAEKARELQSLNDTLERANAHLARTNLKLHDEVAERKRVEEALQVADQRKDKFLAMLAHELRNPLGAIGGATQLLAHVTASEPQLLRLREVLGRQVQHLTRLLDDLLDVSRVRWGRITLRKEPVEIREVIARALESTRSTMNARGHTVSVEMPDDAAWVDGDIVRLTQVLGNLLTNAAKYSGDGTQIKVVAAYEGEVNATAREVVIRVKDSGAGIPPDMLGKIFELFRQVERRDGGAQDGLGLGLALARGLLEMHGGRIEAFSEGLGSGSEFVLRLPLMASAPARTEPAVPAPDTMVTTGTRILVADDNMDLATMVAQLLELSGHEVCVAHTGAAALDAAGVFNPDVALIDIGLPDMDGYEVATRLRNEQSDCTATLIAVTGFGRDVDRQRSKSAGFAHHLVKPIDFDQLSSLLTRVRKDAPIAVE